MRASSTRGYYVLIRPVLVLSADIVSPPAAKGTYQATGEPELSLS